MEPYDIYNSIFFKYIGPFGHFVGVDMVNANYRPTSRTWFWFFINASTFVSMSCTLVVGDFDAKWTSSAFHGLATQGITKYIVLITKAAQIREKVVLLEGIYLANRNSSTPSYQILLKWSNYCLLFAKYASIPVAGVVLLMVLFPFAAYFRVGHLDLIMPLYVPYASPDSAVGLTITLAYQFIVCFLTAMGTCGADFMIVMLVLHLWPMCLIWENMFGQLNRALLNPKQRDSFGVKVHFRNLLLTHKEMCRYLESISDIYYYMLFVEIMTCAHGLIIILFCLNTIIWYPLYLLWLMIFSKLLAYCCLGTIAETATDHVYKTILCSNWYLLPLEEKRYLILLIKKSQKPTILKAGTMQLNMSTFVSVLKTVYSVGMILVGND